MAWDYLWHGITCHCILGPFPRHVQSPLAYDARQALDVYHHLQTVACLNCEKTGSTVVRDPSQTTTNAKLT